MDINDPLRVGSQGIKKDYYDKIAKFYNQPNDSNASTNGLSKNKRYYPADK